LAGRVALKRPFTDGRVEAAGGVVQEG
jgi:hypothetical protein